MPRGAACASAAAAPPWKGASWGRSPLAAAAAASRRHSRARRRGMALRVRQLAGWAGGRRLGQGRGQGGAARGLGQRGRLGSDLWVGAAMPSAVGGHLGAEVAQNASSLRAVGAILNALRLPAPPPFSHPCSHHAGALHATTRRAGKPQHLPAPRGAQRGGGGAQQQATAGPALGGPAGAGWAPRAAGDCHPSGRQHGRALRPAELHRGGHCRVSGRRAETPAPWSPTPPPPPPAPAPCAGALRAPHTTATQHPIPAARAPCTMHYQSPQCLPAAPRPRRLAAAAAAPRLPPQGAARGRQAGRGARPHCAAAAEGRPEQRAAGAHRGV